VLLRVKTGKLTLFGANFFREVFARALFLRLLLFIDKTHGAFVDNLFDLLKLGGAGIEVDMRADNLSAFCILFFVSGSKRGLDGLDYFLARYAALLLELAEHAVHYF
jgi:hypothetical protein